MRKTLSFRAENFNKLIVSPQMGRKQVRARADVKATVINYGYSSFPSLPSPGFLWKVHLSQLSALRSQVTAGLPLHPAHPSQGFPWFSGQVATLHQPSKTIKVSIPTLLQCFLLFVTMKKNRPFLTIEKATPSFQLIKLRSRLLKIHNPKQRKNVKRKLHITFSKNQLKFTKRMSLHPLLVSTKYNRHSQKKWAHI